MAKNKYLRGGVQSDFSGEQIISEQVELSDISRCKQEMLMSISEFTAIKSEIKNLKGKEND